MKLSIIIPCYNEEKNIPLILDSFSRVINRSDIEVILVNNGSLDNSQKVLDELIPKYPFARTVRVMVNQGYGFGILTGLNVAAGDFIGWTHADMQTDPADVLKALYIIEAENCDPNLYVKGERKGRPLYEQFFTTGMSIFETIYLGKSLHDITGQPNIFHKSFYKSWVNPPHDFSLDLYALYMARRANLKINRFHVIFPKRIHGESSWNTGLKSRIKLIKRTIEYSIKLKRDIKSANRS